MAGEVGLFGERTLETFVTVGQWVLPLLYLGLVIDYGMTFFARTRTHVREKWAPAVIVIHAAFLTMRSLLLGYPPLLSGFEILSLIALSTAVVYCAMEWIGRDRRAGVFVFLLVFLLQYMASLFLVGSVAPPSDDAIAQITERGAHSLAAIFAYTAMALAAVHGALHLIGRHDMKRRRLGLLFDRLPPLESLAKGSWYGVLAGLILMTVSIVTGALVFSQVDVADQAGSLTPKIAVKIVVGVIAWVICAVAVAGKVFGRWSDSRISHIAAEGFLLIAAMFVVSLALS